MKADELNKWIVPGLKLAGGVTILFAGYKLLQKVGLIKTNEETTATANEESATADTTKIQTAKSIIAFNPSYRTAIVKAYVNKYGSTGATKFDTAKQIKFTQSQVNSLIKSIYDCKGTFKDDKSKLLTVFKDIQTQYQLSYIAGIFKSVYSKDLYTYLQSFLNEDELLPIQNIVKNYPLYFVKQ